MSSRAAFSQRSSQRIVVTANAWSVGSCRHLLLMMATSSVPRLRRGGRRCPCRRAPVYPCRVAANVPRRDFRRVFPEVTMSATSESSPAVAADFVLRGASELVTMSAPPAEGLGAAARGGGVLPGCVGAHAHVPFAGSRAAEDGERLAVRGGPRPGERHVR